MARKNKRLGGPPEPMTAVQEAKDDLKDMTARAEAVESMMVEMGEKDQKIFTEWIGYRIDAAYNSNVWKETWQRCLRMREYYERGVPRTDIKLENAHDYRSNLAASLADGMRSRLITLFMEDPIVRIEGRNRQGRINAPTAQDFLVYYNTKVIELPTIGSTTVGYLVTEGHCVWYTPWVFEVDEHNVEMVERQKYINGKNGEFKWVDVNSPTERQAATQLDYRPLAPEEFDTVERKQPKVIKNHPELQSLSLIDYINPRDSKPDVPPQWEGIRQYFTLNQLMQLDEKGMLYKGSLEKVRKFMRGSKDEGEMDSRKESYDVNNVVTSDIDSLMPEKDTLDAVVGCWVIWGWMHIPGSKYLRRGMCIYHKQSRTILHCRLNPYIGAPNPIHHLRFIGVPWRFSGIGVMELASPGEQALNDLSNYILDDGLIMNGIPFKYNRKRMPNGISPFEIWKGIGVDRMTDIQEFNVRDRRPMDMAVANFCRANTERRVGIGDLQLGRESDVTGKQPPTARGIMSIVREGQVRFNLLNFSLINSIVNWSEHVLLLYQQLGPRKLVAEIVDDKGNELFPDGLPKRQLLGSFKFIANMDAQGMVREMDAQLNIMLYDLYKDNKLIQSDTEAYWKMSTDVMKSSGKKNMWFSPLSKYQQAQGFSTPSEFEQKLSPEEKTFADSLVQLGMPMEMVEEEVKKLRGEAEPMTKEEAGL